MIWKHKYIAGLTAMTMLFTMPLVSAAEDDLEVFGEQYGKNSEPVNSVEPPAPVIIEEQPVPSENMSND